MHFYRRFRIFTQRKRLIGPVRLAGCSLAVLLIMARTPAQLVRAEDPTSTPPVVTPVPPEPTFSTTPVVIITEGTVTSGTAGIDIPPGLPLTLHVARAGKAG